MALFLGALILIGVEPGIGMMERHLDLTYIIIWSLAIANVIGAGICLFLAKPISRLTLVPFTLVAPFMIVIICFAAFQATRSWEDLITLFVLGVVGMYMKRFGWSRPAFLIGFVLAKQLDASVYQSIQVYGWTFLERGGVQFILALTVISIILALRIKPHREALSADGPHAPLDRRPQFVFLGLLTLTVAYAVYDVWKLDFLAKVFPIAVAVVTLVMLAVAAFQFTRNTPNYVFFDGEREWAENDKPNQSELHYQAWFLGLLALIGLVGFILGIFVYIAAFLRVKASVKWQWAILGALGAVLVLVTFGHVLSLSYPRGLLQLMTDLPWPFD
jgi:hypothetical protein